MCVYVCICTCMCVYVWMQVCVPNNRQITRWHIDKACGVAGITFLKSWRRACSNSAEFSFMSRFSSLSCCSRYALGRVLWLLKPWRTCSIRWREKVLSWKQYWNIKAKRHSYMQLAREPETLLTIFTFFFTSVLFYFTIMPSPSSSGIKLRPKLSLSLSLSLSPTGSSSYTSSQWLHRQTLELAG